MRIGRRPPPSSALRGTADDTSPGGGGESDPPVSFLAGDRQLTAPFRQGGQTGMLGGKIFRLRCAALRMTEPGGFMRIRPGSPTVIRLAGDGGRHLPRWGRQECGADLYGAD